LEQAGRNCENGWGVDEEGEIVVVVIALTVIVECARGSGG
jgi:hypothetical protein